ncbi:MAG: hypothetical protein IPJ12_08305 [Betaproteobacteria bacterium]|nr:hypothetical protein [Betaproteobacteria bacterium]
MFRTFLPKPAAHRSMPDARAGRKSGTGIRDPNAGMARQPVWPATKSMAQCNKHHTPVDKPSAPHSRKSFFQASAIVADFSFCHFFRLTAERPKAVQKDLNPEIFDCQIPNKKTPLQPAFLRDLHHRCAKKKIVLVIEKMSSKRSYNAPSFKLKTDQ